MAKAPAAPPEGTRAPAGSGPDDSGPAEPGWLRRFERRLNGVIGAVVVILMIASAALAFVGVVLRYGFGISYGLIEELCRYFIVYAVLLYFGPLITRDSHLSMSIVPDMLPERARGVLDVGIHAALAVMLLVMSVAAWQWEFGLHAMNLLTMSGELRAWVPSASLPIGITIAFFYCVLRTVYRASGAPPIAAEDLP